jgi:hypothetical protein
LNKVQKFIESPNDNQREVLNYKYLQTSDYYQLVTHKTLALQHQIPEVQPVPKEIQTLETQPAPPENIHPELTFWFQTLFNSPPPLEDLTPTNYLAPSSLLSPKASSGIGSHGFVTTEPPSSPSQGPPPAPPILPNLSEDPETTRD